MNHESDNFIFVVPKGITLPEDFGYKYIEVDHLLNPSIIFTGAYMSTPNSAESTKRASNILSFIKGLISRDLPEPVISAPETTNASAPIVEQPVQVLPPVTKRAVSDVSEAQQESPFFRHIRAFNSDGSIASRGGLTLSIDIDAEAKVLHFSYALCNPLDNFVKGTSRQKAEGRLRSAAYTFRIENLNPSLTVLQNIDAALCGFIALEESGNPIFDSNPRLTSIPSACTLDVVKKIADHVAAFNDKESGLSSEL